MKRSVVTIHVGGAVGSGFVVDIITKPPYEVGILTAEHVVDAATYVGGPPVYVSQGGNRQGAHLIGWDRGKDLALLEIREHLPPLPWASDRGHPPQVGDFVVAIGSPYGLEGTTTVGIISKVYAGLVQTDAAMNPGNSGGPLINRYGEVVGINDFKLSGESLNFAVKIEAACHYVIRC